MTVCFTCAESYEHFCYIICIVENLQWNFSPINLKFWDSIGFWPPIMAPRFLPHTSLCHLLVQSVFEPIKFTISALKILQCNFCVKNSILNFCNTDDGSEIPGTLCTCARWKFTYVKTLKSIGRGQKPVLKQKFNFCR